jgi:hypothetical protein
MFDKLLCNRIQKKHIKISDVFEYILPYALVSIIGYLIVFLFGEITYTLILHPTFTVFNMSCMQWIDFHFCGLIGVSTVLLIGSIIKMVLSIEIATCQNTREEENEEK